MSVVVLGMEMPTKCCDCDAEQFVEDAYGYDFGHECSFVYKGYTEDIRGRGRLEECPLRPLPEKHGRLVDVDDMERFMSDIVQWDIRQYPYSDTLWDMAFQWIDSRPTIIEEED